jgi:hypothetical protein
MWEKMAMHQSSFLMCACGGMISTLPPHTIPLASGKGVNFGAGEKALWQGMLEAILGISSRVFEAAMPSVGDVKRMDELKDENSFEILDRYIVSERIKIRISPNGQQIDGDRVFVAGAIVNIHPSKETQKVDGSDVTWIKVYYNGNEVAWVGKEYLEELPPQITEHNYRYDWDKQEPQYVTQEFKDKVAGVATALEVDPDDLMAIMAFESQFNPAQKNLGGSSGTGLVQFMSDTARALNTTTDDLAKMSGVEQMDYVYALFYPVKDDLNNLGDLYMQVFCPDGVGKDDDYPLYESGSLSYSSNARLDTNKDGIITREEAVQEVINNRENYEN